MLESLKLLSGKRKQLYALLLLISFSLICVAFSMTGNDDFENARREILFRRIGHEMLLQAGDSISRVLPVKKISENEYQISFDNPLSFEPKFLVNTTMSLFAKEPFAGNYVVNVLNCGNASVAYGFAISKNKALDIVACIGRVQPTACYMVNIKFEGSGINTSKYKYVLGSLPFLLIGGFIFLRMIKRQRTLPDNQDINMTKLGSMLFDANNRKLIINEKSIDLTGTETRLLQIFALSPNEVIERS